MTNRLASGLLLFVCGYGFGVSIMQGELWLPLGFSAIGFCNLMLVTYDVLSKRAAPEEKK